MHQSSHTGMHDMYRYEQAWGWSDGRKKSELNDSDARFVIAFRHNAVTEKEEPVAYIHLRFVDDDGAVPAIYVLSSSRCLSFSH